MIKTLLTQITLITGCAISQVNAQIQNMNPSPGNVFTYESFDLVVADSGSVGNNQTWDFSDAVSFDESYTQTFRALTTQEQADYPFANLAYTEDGDPTVYLMHAGADSLTDFGDVDFLLSNPVVLYKYPITSTYNFTDVSGIDGIDYNATINTFSQGNGTLITPFGTYNNVMKIRRKGIVNYSFGGQSEQVLVDGYVWINAENKTELLTIESSHFVNGTEEDEVYAYFLQNGVVLGLDKKEANAFSLYPNPATNMIYVKSAVSEPVSYQIYSVTGILVQSGKYVSGQGISTEKLQSGGYIFQVVSTDGKVSHEKFSKL